MSGRRARPGRLGRLARRLARGAAAALGARRGAVGAALLLLVLGATAWAAWSHGARDLGPEQPIAFSHRIHADVRGISCLFCHEGALEGARAGIPPLSTCMLCHDEIATLHPEVRKVREAFEQARPVRWVRVGDLPDHTFFDHGVHVRAGVDCGDCHGDVRGMDRVRRHRSFEMGWCLDCHRRREAPTGCLRCHR